MKNKGKWVYFPTEENWDNETEIDDGIVYLKHQTILTNREKGFWERIFSGCGELLTEAEYPQNIAGVITIGKYSHTEPFCIWQNKDGSYNEDRFKTHPKKIEIEAKLKASQ